MNLKDKMVKHKVFGLGAVIKHSERHLTVSFEIGEKTFVFPDAFSSYLEAQDPSLAAEINHLLQEQANERLRIQQEKEQHRILEQQRITEKPKRAVKAKARAERPNIAFKCNYCDGGKSDQQVGFYGVCSDPIIHNNIKVENRTWCNAEDCPCLQYYNNKISRKELDAQCENGGFVCYESQMLREWKAKAGVVQHGVNAGSPMKLNQVQRNSLCVLTTRDPQCREDERYIFAVFLVDETHEGDGDEEGYVTTKSKYKVKLSPPEAHSLLFWNYHANDNNPENAAWNSGLHRYFDDVQSALILRDIAGIKMGTSDEQLAAEFFDYFCTINGVDRSLLEKPSGALSLNQ